MFELIDYFKILLIIYLGIKTSISDIKEHKIKNKDLLFVFSSYLLLEFIFFKFPIDWNILLRNLGSLGFSLFIFSIFYVVGFLSAGDVKLLGLYYLLFPFKVNNVLNMDLFFKIIIWYLILFGIYFIFKIIKKNKLKQIFKIMILSFNHKSLFNIFLFMFSFSWISNLIINFVSYYIYIPYPMIFSFVIAIFFFYQLDNLMINRIYVLLVIALIRLYTYQGSYMNLFLFSITSTIFVYLVRYLGNYVSYYFLTKKVQIEKLKEGIWLADIVYLKKEDDYTDEDKKLMKKLKPENKFILTIDKGIEYNQFSIFRRIFKKPYYPINRSLNTDEVNDLIKKHKIMQLKEHYLRIHETIAFAPGFFIVLLLVLIFTLI